MTEQKIIDKFFSELDSLAKEQPEIDLTKVKQAVEFARQAHQGQVRKSNDFPFIVHPLEVAYCLWFKY